MRRKISVILLLSSLMFLLLILIWGNKWEKYYKNKLYQPPHQLVERATQSFINSGEAIDLGCGVGNETVFLLKNGWKVWALDHQAKAIQLLKGRRDIVSFEKLIAIRAEFDKLCDLPSVDLMYAGYSLPFCHPEEFESTWDHIKEKILPGGRFAGHFFGFNYQGFAESEKKIMTFLTKEKIYSLFEDFTIEYFEEQEEDGRSGAGKAIHAHIFEVIAKRN